jgi:phosphoribosylglycinamide formyltransferase-1
VRDTLYAGAQVSGVTIHVVDEGVDTGPHIAQASVPVLAEDSEYDLHERIKVVERELLIATVKDIATKKIHLPSLVK